MTKQLEALIAEMKDKSMVTAEDFNTLIAALEQSQQHNKELQTKLDATEAVALALRDEVRGAAKRVAELEASETQLIEERDKAYRQASAARNAFDEQYRQREAAERRILELEASPLVVKLPAACADDEYFIDGVFQPLRYERDVIRAIVAAGCQVEGE
jgi:uncharacterized phage infection (PIP) family protein YhgE